MGGLAGAFGIIGGALSSDQEAIEVTSNNVGNANTPGYTRQVANWSEADPVTINGIQFGRGGEVTSVSSQRDRVLEARIQQQQQSQSAAQAQQTALTAVENIFNQVTTGSSDSSSSGSGIGGTLNGFFNALSQLQSNPSDSSVRQGVLSSAQNLASSLNSASLQLSGESSSLNLQVGDTVQQINDLTGLLAKLNQQIESTSPNSDAGTLEDQRQQDLSNLSRLIGFDQIRTEDNGLTLTTTGGTVLVAGNQSYALTTSNVGGVQAVFAGSANITSSLTGGSLGGSLEVLTREIPSVQASLDTLANALGTQVNAVQAAGVDANGNPGGPLFTLPSTVAGSATSISVAITDPSLIAAAQTGAGPGDGTNAKALAGLSQQQIVNGNTPVSYYAQLVSSIGSSVQTVQTQSSAIIASLTQLQTQRDSLSAVSQDEEASNLQTLERAYQAAAKMFSILDSLMATALNLGVPGVAAQ